MTAESEATYVRNALIPGGCQPAQREQALLHLAPEIVLGPPERFVSRADEVALLFAKAGKGLAITLGERCLVRIVDLAVEPGKVRIRTDRLLNGAARSL